MKIQTSAFHWIVVSRAKICKSSIYALKYPFFQLYWVGYLLGNKVHIVEKNYRS